MALEETDYFQNHNCISNRRLLLFCGIWPYQKSSQRLLRTRTIIAILMLGVIMQIRALMASDFTLETIMEIMETLIPSISFTFCYYNMCNNYVTVKLIMDCIIKKWNETDNEGELKSMQKYTEETKFYLLFMSWIVFIYLIFSLFPSAVHVILYTAGVMNKSQLILPFEFEHTEHNKIHFFLLLIAQYVITILFCSIGIAYGTIHLSLLQHVYTLFDIVMIKMDEPFKKSRDNFYWVCSNNKHDEEYDWIITVAKCYNEAINFVGLVRLLSEKSLLVEASLAILYMIIDIFYLLHLDNLLENMDETLQTCIYISGTLFLTYAYCYLGQKVINQNENLFIKCCQIPIYTLSVKTQKVVLLLITRMLRPCHFSVKGMLIVSNESFLTVLRASYSFTMVFQNM